MNRSLYYILLCVVLLAACSDDNKGGNVPGLVSELCDVYINQNKIAATATLDDGTVLDISAQGLNASVADTTIRSMLMYAAKDGKVTVYSQQPAVCQQAMPKDRFEIRPYDPLNVVSIWQKGRYINMVLGIMTTDKKAHNYGFCIDSLKSRTLYCSLLHRQPSEDAESYTKKVYASMPVVTSHATGYDSITMNIVTYDGLVSYSFKTSNN